MPLQRSKWEYTTAQIGSITGEEVLNGLGEAGWELITIREDDNIGIFKRPIEDKIYYVEGGKLDNPKNNENTTK